jgi:SNF2 family DNA or RNA helicase
MDSHTNLTFGGSGLHWRPPLPRVVCSVDLCPEAARWAIDPVIAGWNRQLARPSAVDVYELPTELVRPPVVSVPIRRPNVRVRSYRFAQPDEEVGQGILGMDAHAGASDGMSTKTHLGGTLPRGSTRIKPPGDVIKLQDRLHYLLQPSLESLMAERLVGLPHDPFPFQLEGIAFLYPRQAAILADEMGLGKTMQTITTVRLLLRCGELRTVLIVCPKALVTNWQREFALWAPEIPLLVIEGDQARRQWQWQLADMAVRIVNYELLYRDRDVLEGKPGVSRPGVRFDLAVLDESQRIKNRAGTTSQAARSISRRRSWALTGTPVENSPEDLVGIFEFLAPGYLSPALKPRRMGRAVSDYVLRRTKEQVLSDLPPKLYRDAELELSPEQRQSYDLAEEKGILRLTDLGASASIQHVFELVLRLKQICNFDPATGASSKLEQLQADLEEIAGSGRKAILFSQWVGTLKELARRLRRFGPLEYHGQVPASRRDAVIRRFRDDVDSHLLLMSYGAGGVGLNLQFANYLFLFDRWWNPAVEDQAIARAHRIGASGPVTVTRFLIRDTIEQRIDQILQEKRDLFDTIFSGEHTPTNLGLSQEDLFGLFQLQSPASSLGRAA